MTALDIQKINLLVILFNIILIIFINLKYRKYWLWFIPIFLLLIHGMVFGVVYIIDKIPDGIVDPVIYNLWSSILHLQDKTTITVYAVALLLKDWNTESISEKLKAVEVKAKKLMRKNFSNGGEK
jgi:hypothetical protein